MGDYLAAASILVIDKYLINLSNHDYYKSRNREIYDQKNIEYKKIKENFIKILCNKTFDNQYSFQMFIKQNMMNYGIIVSTIIKTQ